MEKLALIFRISWRSIWRNRRRTWITLSAIAFGLALAVFFIAFADGVYNQLIDDATRMQGGHFTLEHPQYREAPAVDLFVGGVSGLRARLEALDGVGGTKALVLGQGVARSGHGAVGVSVMGVEPSFESAASPIAASMAAGSYLEEGDGRKVVVGTGLAKRLRLRPGRKLVLATNDASGEIVEELFRVKGTFEVGSDEVDAYLVQIPLESARRLYGLGVDDATQVGVLLADAGRRPAVMAAAREFVPVGVALRTWEEVMPELANYIRVEPRRQPGLPGDRRLPQPVHDLQHHPHVGAGAHPRAGHAARPWRLGLHAAPAGGDRVRPARRPRQHPRGPARRGPRLLDAGRRARHLALLRG